MSLKTDRLCFALFGFCLILSTQTLGQSIGGTFFGVVKDPTGVVPQAEVQITNLATGQVRFVFTGERGTYELREVPPGVYELKVSKDGYNTVTTPPSQGLQLGLGQVSRVDDIMLTVAPAGSSEIQVNALDLAMTDSDRPTLSTAFTERQISDLPLSARDINNLAPLAPGVVSVSSFSFANTLVPFSVNGSRGRDNNFIIDSVDNNEPLFGGAATQFTNSEIFSEFRILTGQFQAEYGRNSGSIVNVVTKTGGKELHGSVNWYGQNDALNAMTKVEKESRLTEPARFYENQLGASVGGPIKRDSTWYFASYQWDRARNDLSSEYPVVATLPTSAGLATLQSINAATPRPTLTVFLADPTVRTLPTLTSPFAAPCAVPDTTNLNATNPCTNGTATWDPTGGNCSGTPNPCVGIDFGTYLVPRANLFDYRDHQGSARIDQMLGQRDNLFFRYLLDDLRTPLGAVSDPSQVEFSDLGLLPQWRPILAQRTQNFGSAWTHAFDRALNELRFSVSRVSSERGPLDADPRVRELPALTVTNRFDSEQPQFVGLFTQSPRPAPVGFAAAGDFITMGSDTRSSQFNTYLYQLQENFSFDHGRHSLKFGGNLIETRTDLREINGDLGHYFYGSFSDFVNNVPGGSTSNLDGYQRFGNFGGKGGEVLPLREFAQFYFAEDDIKFSPSFTLNLGIRYENYGQGYNAVVDRSASNNFRPPRLDRVNTNLAPRIGFAWGLGKDTVLRGGYGIYFDPTFFNIPLLVWQSGPISPYVSAGSTALGANFSSSSLKSFPSRPFDSSVVSSLAPYSSINQNTVSQNLRNPFVHNASLSLQRQFQKDFLLELSYFGSRGTKLFQRRDLNPFGGWSIPQGCNPCSTVFLRPRPEPNRGSIIDVSNGGFSNYHAFQFSGTKRLREPSVWNGLALTGAYTWSHMTDNASEIFGPGIQQALSGPTFPNTPFNVTEPFEISTPFPQNASDPRNGEKGNSSFDRRHRLSLSAVWVLPSPTPKALQIFLGAWEVNGVIAAQSGQPFTPVNSSLLTSGGFAAINSALSGGAPSGCGDAGGDGILFNDRPNIGNPKAPANTVALLNNIFCLDASNSVANAIPIVQGQGPYVTPDGKTINPKDVRFVQVPVGGGFGSAGRNILTGPASVNFDLSLSKSFRLGERLKLQLRGDAYDLLNRQNPGTFAGNSYVAAAQKVPAAAFYPRGLGVGPSDAFGPFLEGLPNLARVSGSTPMNSIDAVDPATGKSLFLSPQFLTTSSRRMQFSVKLAF